VITAIGESELRIGFGERFLDICLNERLLVRDELVEHGIGDACLGCVNAIAYPTCAGVVIAILEDTRCDRLRWVPRYSVVGEDSRCAPADLLLHKSFLLYGDGVWA